MSFRGEKDTNPHPVGTMGTFNRETDITWDPQDNMFVSDGYLSTAVSDASDLLRIAMIPPPITSAMPRTTNSVGAA